MLHSMLDRMARFGKRLTHRPQTDELAFRSGGLLTLGVEIELQIIDPESMNLAARAEELLKAGQHIGKLKPEFYLTTAEINTDKCQNVQEVERDFEASFSALRAVGDSLGLAFATTGCHPFTRYADCLITPSKRYDELIDRNQWLTRRMTVYGLHVHVGMASGDDCIRYNNFFLHFMPHLLALSASSPFWQGDDTGLAACRPSTYEALPTAGHPYRIGNWRDFEALYHTLIKCKAISSLKDMWWDMRPSPNFGTLEIRVCDGPATLAEAMAIVAYVHLLAHWFSDHGGWIDQVPRPTEWLMRENKWRSMRHGLAADMVVNLEGDTKPVAEDIAQWLDVLAPYAEKLGYGAYMQTLRAILVKGNSTMRQRGVFARTGSLQDVVAFNVREFNAGAPLWEEAVG